MRWPRVKIESLKAETRNALVGGPFGSDLSTRHYVEEGVPVIRGANLPDEQSFKDDDFVKRFQDEVAPDLPAGITKREFFHHFLPSLTKIESATCQRFKTK